ncbi:MAG: hypothetical protein ABSE92_03785, partial [Terriglobales bacterium]
SMYLCLAGPIFAQSTDSQSTDSSKSWTATTDSNEDSANPTRTTESHTQNGDRTVDTRSVQTRGPDGTMSPYQNIETETIQLNATSTRTITRTFIRDANGAKTLFQITQEEKQTLPDGGSKIVRSTSNPDANGNLQVVQREVQETAIPGPGAQDTKTTVLLPSIDGTLAPTMQTHELQQRSGNNIEIQKTTLLPDGSGNWQVGEVKKETIKNDGKNSSQQEDVSRPDSEGNLGEVSKTVTHESENAAGDKKKEEESYSLDLPGTTRDGNLHPIQHVTTTQHSDAGGQQTTKISAAPNSGNPDSSMQVTVITNDTVRLGPAGAQASRTIQWNDANRNLGIVFVDTAKSNNAHAVEVQIAPSHPK